MSRDKYASFLYKQTCSCHPPFFPWHFWILTITKIIFQLCLLQFQFQKWNIFILKMAKSRWCVYAIQNKYKTKLTFFFSQSSQMHTLVIIYHPDAFLSPPFFSGGFLIKKLHNISINFFQSLTWSSFLKIILHTSTEDCTSCISLIHGLYD